MKCPRCGSLSTKQVRLVKYLRDRRGIIIGAIFEYYCCNCNNLWEVRG